MSILDSFVLEPKKVEDCSHPLEHRRFDGVQEGFNRKPQLILSTCMLCKTTLSDQISYGEILWWAIECLAQRVRNLENGARKVGQFL